MRREHLLGAVHQISPRHAGHRLLVGDDARPGARERLGHRGRRVGGDHRSHRETLRACQRQHQRRLVRLRPAHSGAQRADVDGHRDRRVGGAGDHHRSLQGPGIQGLLLLARGLHPRMALAQGVAVRLRPLGRYVVRCDARTRRRPGRWRARARAPARRSPPGPRRGGGATRQSPRSARAPGGGSRRSAPTATARGDAAGRPLTARPGRGRRRTAALQGRQPGSSPRPPCRRRAPPPCRPRHPGHRAAARHRRSPRGRPLDGPRRPR